MALLLHGARGRPLPVPRNERHCPDFGLGEVVKKGCNLSLVHGAPYHVSSGTRRDVSLFFFPIRLFTKVEFGILEQRRIYLSQAVHSTTSEETSGEVTRFPEAFAWVGDRATDLRDGADSGSLGSGAGLVSGRFFCAPQTSPATGILGNSSFCRTVRGLGAQD